MSLQRCLRPSKDSFPLYGGKGITVCDRWRTFENFLADMGERPNGASLDRIDSAGNYEPANCRWASAVEQANNKRTNRIIEFNGRSQTIAQWARETGIAYECLYGRLLRGWSPERALNR